MENIVAKNIEIGIKVKENGDIKALNDFENKVKSTATAEKKMAEATKLIGNESTKTTKKVKDTSSAIKTLGDNSKKSSKEASSLSDAIGGLGGPIGRYATQFKGLSSSITALFKNPVVGFGVASTAIVAGLGTISLKLADVIGQMKDNADSIGITVSEYQTMNAMLIQNGSSMDKFSGAFATFQDKVASGDKLFQKYGVSITDSNGFLKSSIDIQDEFLLKVSKMSSETEKLAALTDAYGKKGRSMMASVASEADYRAARELAKSLVIPPNVIKSYDTLGNTIDELKGKILKGLATSFEPFTIAFNDMVKTISNSSLFKDIIRGIADFASATGFYITRIIDYVLSGWNALYNTMIIGLDKLSTYYNKLAEKINAKLAKTVNAGKKAIMIGPDADYYTQNYDKFVENLIKIQDMKEAAAKEDIRLKEEVNKKKLKLDEMYNDQSTVYSEEQYKIAKKELKDAEDAVRKYNAHAKTAFGYSFVGTRPSGTPYGGLLPDPTQIDWNKLESQGFNALSDIQTLLFQYMKTASRVRELANEDSIDLMPKLDFSDQAADAEKQLEEFRKKVTDPNFWKFTGSKPTTEDKSNEKENKAVIAQNIDFVTTNKQIYKGLTDWIYDNNVILSTLDQKLADNERSRLEKRAEAELELQNYVFTSEEEKLRLHNEVMLGIDAAYTKKANDIRNADAEEQDAKTRANNEKEQQELANRISTITGYISNLTDAWKNYMDVRFNNQLQDISNTETSEKEKLNLYNMSARRKYQMEKEISDKAMAEEKKVKEQQKKWSIAQALINGALGVTNAWANGGTMASNIIESAVIGTVTGFQVAAIQAQNFRNSGIVGGASGATEGRDTVTVGARPGEMFLNGRDQRNLMSMIKGNKSTGGQSINIQQGDIVIQGGANQSAIDQIKAETQKFSNLVKETVLDLQYRRQLSFA